jgi:ribosomal protein S19E (S16A)
MSKHSQEVADLLKKLQEQGAVVKEGDKQGQIISPKVMSDLQTNAAQDFEAWVSWTKSFS